MQARADATSAAEPPLGLAIIGCGRVVERFHLPALRRSARWRIRAALDTSPERRRRFREVAPQAAVIGALEPLLGLAGLDAVLVSTPPSTHAALVTRALRAGLHVLVEKPMGISTAEAGLMCRAARETGRVLAVGFVRRHRKPYRRLHERLRKVPAASIRRVRLQLCFDPRAWGASSGYLGQASGGGVLEDVASHQIDLVPWLLRAPIRSVRVCRWERRPDGEEILGYELELQNGLRASCTAGHGPGHHERVWVERGGIALAAHAYGMLPLPRPLAPAFEPLARLQAVTHLARCRLTGRANTTVASFERQLDAFADAVCGRPQGDSLADGASGLACQRALEACRRSRAADGAWQPLSPGPGRA